MSSFISSSGLAYLWSKIKEYISANTGTYSKPSGGIPKSDLASTVLASLDKADTALLSHQSVSNKNADIGTSLTTIATIGSTDIKAKITHQDISGKADKSATVSTVAYDTTNKKLTKTINGTTTDVVTAAKIVTDGGGITSETDPVFLASPAAGITSQNITTWSDAAEDVNGNTINGASLTDSTSYWFGTSSTAAATVQKEVSIPSIKVLNVGQIIVVKPTVTSTVADSTLKLNSFDAYPMRYNNAAITTSTDSVVWNLNYPSIWLFDGTYWVFLAHGIDSNTTYSAMSVSEGTTGTATSSRTMRADYLKQIIETLAPQSDWEEDDSTDPAYIKNKPTIPSKTSDLTNDSGYITGYTETDPIFSASAASGITSSDINNWNNKTSNVGTITGINMNGVSKGTSGVVDLGTVITAHLDISGKANLASPAFTGTPTAPTAAAGTSTTQIATTAFVLNELSDQFDEITEIIEDNEEVVASALNDLNSRIENMVVEETDPTVPDWAKSPYPPTYLYYDVGALSAYSYVDGVGFSGGTTINHFATCSTSASTTAKTASKASFQLSTGAEIIVKFTYTNTASNPTLNINNTGARSIYYNGTNIPASALAANRVYKFVYDGSYWQLVGTLGYTKTSELTNDAGFLTSDDVVDEVNLEDKLVTSNAVYEYITEDEKVIASALNDLNERIGDNEIVTAAALNDLNSNKQNKLVSGTNIKTINNLSLLGEGNITISGGGSGGDVNVIETVKVNGTALTPDSNKAVNISAVTSFNGSTGAITYSAPVTSVNGNTGAVVLNIPAAVTESTVSGWGFTKNAGTITGVTGSNGLTGSGTSGSVTISHAAPSTSPAKTTSAVYPITIDLYGHITATGTAVTIPTQVTESTVSGWGFTKNAGTITGINMNGASKGTSGVVDLGTVITAHQDISGKADKSEMSVVAGTGANADKTTITLKTGTSATVLTAHQDISGKADSATTLAGYGITDAYTKTETDGRYYALYGGTAISGTSSSHYDLNTLTTAGSYYCNSNTTAGYIDNKPSNDSTSFRVWVSIPRGTETSSVRQRFQFYNTVEIYERVKIGSSSWSSWYPVQDDLTYKPNIYTGSSAPSSGTGSNGDIYIQTS